jgi:hypothetical protein
MKPFLFVLFVLLAMVAMTSVHAAGDDEDEADVDDLGYVTDDTDDNRVTMIYSDDGDAWHDDEMNEAELAVFNSEYEDDDSTDEND